ncbi:DUF4097 family beta strand repeat-containing protein [Mycolicibacterium sp. 120266]|uniref:DUF4097 family beta strand repeat-containing protein n=1 Tax=Mycolicibacterium sp. 120266 TaxID=3090601 RepID=UPI00299DF43C|nr:DUF4097 family beta strand repeat-containing protein [Mycolicibacterium sp. 120266]MDX1875531.1 DUF4097 family beta strand repeat-containing protein [Mycolicibacterium sp. 120266]
MTITSPDTLTPPAPTDPPHLSTGGRSVIRVLLVAVAAVVIVGAVTGLGALAWGLSAFRVVTDHQTLPTAIRSLTLDTADSPVAVRITADRNVTEPRIDLRMVASTRNSDQHLRVTNDADGTHVIVAGAAGGLFDFGDPGEVTVTLPPETGRQLALTVRQNTGVLLAQADLDQLTASTSDGAVVLRGAVRRVEVRAQDGEITAHQPISVAESFDATTTQGDISVKFADVAPRQVQAVTRDGDISLSLPAPGPYLVHAQSGGSATVRVPETGDATRAAAQITARSDDGNVTIDTLR